MEFSISLHGGGTVAVSWPVELRTVYLDVEVTDDGEEIPRDPRVAVVVDGVELVTRFTDEARLRAAIEGKVEHHRRLAEEAERRADEERQAADEARQIAAESPLNLVVSDTDTDTDGEG